MDSRGAPSSPFRARPGPAAPAHTFAALRVGIGSRTRSIRTSGLAGRKARPLREGGRPEERPGSWMSASYASWEPLARRDDSWKVGETKANGNRRRIGADAGGAANRGEGFRLNEVPSIGLRPRDPRRSRACLPTKRCLRSATRWPRCSHSNGVLNTRRRPWGGGGGWARCAALRCATFSAELTRSRPPTVEGVPSLECKAHGGEGWDEDAAHLRPAGSRCESGASPSL